MVLVTADPPASRHADRGGQGNQEPRGNGHSVFDSSTVEVEQIAQMLGMLSPASQDMVAMMVRQLAEREGVAVVHTASAGLQLPADGIQMWVAELKSQTRSNNTIHLYTRAASSYLAQDPTPTSLSIKQHLAAEMDRVSEARVKTIRNALASLFTFLHSEGLWPNNPLATISRIKVAKRRRQPPATQDVMVILRGRGRPKFKMIFLLLVDTGIRIDECCSILRDDIDLAARRIRVIGKGNKERWVPVSPETTHILRAYLADTPTDSIYLFPSKRKKGYANPKAYRTSLHRACNRIGIKHITPHQLRHHFATTSLNAGARLDVVSHILGHASVAITADIYVHVDDAQLSEAHDKYGPLAQMHRALPEPQ